MSICPNMADANLSSLQSQLKERIEGREGGDFVSAINVKELVKAGHEICLAAQKLMCYRISQAAWFSHLELRIREEVLGEKLAGTVVDVMEICDGVLCVAMPPVALECEAFSAAISVATDLVEYVLQFMQDEAMNRHLSESEEARRMYILALSNFAAECKKIAELLDIDEQTSLRFSLFLMQLGKQFEQLGDTDSQWLLKILTCEESMQIIRLQFKNDVDFNESMCDLMKWGTKNLTSVQSCKVGVSDILEMTQNLATVGEHLDVVGEVPGKIVTVLQALNGDNAAFEELAKDEMSGVVKTVATQCMGILSAELAAKDLYTKWYTKDSEQNEQVKEVHEKLEEIKTNVETLIRAAQFWEIYSVPKVAVNQEAIAKYHSAMKANAIELNSPFERIIDEGKKARGANVNQPYHFGDFSRGAIATGKISRGANADDSYQFGDFTRGLAKAFS